MTIIFPDDDNGNVLRGMYEDGDDLSQPRDIDFTVVLPNSDAVQEFGSRFYNLGLQVKAKKPALFPSCRGM
jgi:Regulator of ribonuclease activity B